MPAIFEQISEALIDGMSKKVVELVNKALEEGQEPKAIINEALLPEWVKLRIFFRKVNCLFLKY